MLLLALGLGCAQDPEPAVEPASQPVPRRAVVAQEPVSIHVDRLSRTIEVVDAQGVRHSEAIGIGRGGLGEKTSMGDLITPTGVFTVDLVLHAAGTHNAVAPSSVEPFLGQSEFMALLSPDGLGQLFTNMLAIDFDGDGDPDAAYGDAYIGLSSPDAVTGPKMRRHSSSELPYWYSIALHATPDPANLGAANSGGCVHVDASLLDRLIREGTLAVGRELTIADGALP